MSSNINYSPSWWFHESLIDIDDSNEDDPSDVDESNAATTDNISLTEDGYRSDAGSTGDNFITTEGTFEGLGSLQPEYTCIISDCIKSVFSIDKPKDW